MIGTLNYLHKEELEYYARRTEWSCKCTQHIKFYIIKYKVIYLLRTD